MSDKKTIQISFSEVHNALKFPLDVPMLKGQFKIQIGKIVISSSRTKKPEVVHITTGRADSLEGGDFKVSELERAIQDFFDKNF
jgi:hypothetical protein